jgi:hypothetical protein
MANLFPDIHPTEWEPDWDRFQERDTARSGRLQINTYDPTFEFSARAKWSMAERTTEFELIEDHWWANATNTFDLYHFWPRKLRDVFVAIADGISTTYTLPAKEVASPIVKHNNAVPATQPALFAGTGAQLADQIQYTAATKPANGVVITLSAAEGRQLFKVNYRTVKFAPRHREADLWIIEVEFIQDLFS